MLICDTKVLLIKAHWYFPIKKIEVLIFERGNEPEIPKREI